MQTCTHIKKHNHGHAQTGEHAQANLMSCWALEASAAPENSTSDAR